MVKIYGIKNCDTVKKACRYLDNNNQEYEFVDFKKNGIDESSIKKWKKLGLKRFDGKELENNSNAALIIPDGKLNTPSYLKVPYSFEEGSYTN